ncbi:A24 family peptidase [Sediminibacillus massiliensis]|uniref:A24 family peptidase n=1 Tax=Sediminibacillus massiliensis TaxID=1926277 RepID=UPI001FE4FF78|nr:prepilin peptidase [Sediminibacillus massiliensis]
MINVFLLTVLLICVVTDLKSRKIYNKVIYPSLLLAFIFHFAVAGWQGLSHAFIGFLIGFGLLLIPYFMGGMGAGDVKLIALIGALKGGAFVFQSFLYIAIVGALMALSILFVRRGMFKSIVYYVASLRGGVRLPGGISRGSLTATYPYGVAIAAGVVLHMITEGWNVL